MSHPFNDLFLRDWLFDLYPISGFSLLLTEGDGPFAQNDFNAFLQKRNFFVFNLNSPDRLSSDTLIVGRDNWDADRLGSLIIERSGQILKVYSQEMFLSYLLTNKDLFQESHELLKRFAIGHSALEYLMDLGFYWPSTMVLGGGNTEINNQGWPEIGLLKYMGYTVGEGGIREAIKRQEKLAEIYKSPKLPFLHSPSYMAEWGNPKSCQRLQKIANSIAAFCRTAKHRSRPLQRAISDYESDLNWLYNRFYQGQCSFSWPSTYVE